MPLIPTSFQVNDVVELYDGRIAVITDRAERGFRGRVIQPWLSPNQSKPVPSDECAIATEQMRHILEDQLVSWVSPAYLHLTSVGAYQSEYHVAKQVSKELAPLQLCIIREDPWQGITQGMYVNAAGAVVVTSRSHTVLPPASVLAFVIENFSVDGVPALPGLTDCEASGDPEGHCLTWIAQHIGATRTESPQFFGENLNDPDDLWWAKRINGVFVAATAFRVSRERFVAWCKDRWGSETNQGEQKQTPTGISQRFDELFNTIREFYAKAVPNCLAWLTDDRWSDDIRWMNAHRALPQHKLELSARWDLGAAKALAADIATGLEDYLLDETEDLTSRADKGVPNEVLLWSVAEDGGPFQCSGLILPSSEVELIVRYLKSEFGAGLVEVVNPASFQWAGEGYETLNRLRVSKPELLVVEGAAGTGKTIAMVHRAVDASGRVGKVLIVVPTHVFKRRLKFLLRRVGFRGQNSRRNTIEVRTPDLMGGELRNLASLKAYRRKKLEWGNKRHRPQWDEMIAWYKEHEEPGTKSNIGSALISRSIAIQELLLHSKIRSHAVKPMDPSLAIPSYGAIFVDEAQDLKGWDWMKLISYSLEYLSNNPNTLPEIAAYVDRRQDAFGTTPNFEVVGPDTDTDFVDDSLVEAVDGQETTEVDRRSRRNVMRDTYGILRTPLFDVTRARATSSTDLTFRWTPEKALRRYSIGFKMMQDIRKQFRARVTPLWQIQTESLSTVLRQSQTLANNAAAVVVEIERRHGLSESKMNRMPLVNPPKVSAIESLTARNSEELRSRLQDALEASQREETLRPVAIAVRERSNAIALALMTSSLGGNVQSSFMIKKIQNMIVKDREDKPMLEDKVMRLELAAGTLGKTALNLVVPVRGKHDHRVLHRRGADCQNYGARRLSHRASAITVGTIASLKGLEFGSLIGVGTTIESLSAQEKYIMYSRPRFQLTVVEVSRSAMESSAEYQCARIIEAILPPWGGIVFCDIDVLAQWVTKDWITLQEVLVRERDRLSEMWKTMSGRYGKDDQCVHRWGLFREQ